MYENCSANMDSLVEFCTGSPITQGKQVNLKRTVGRGGAFQVGVPFCVPGGCSFLCSRWVFLFMSLGWPLSGVVYFNILRIYIITRFVQCKTVAHYHETFKVFSFTVFFTLWLKHNSCNFLPTLSN